MKTDENTIFFRVEAKNINFVNRIFEGYEHLGVVTTVDKANGLLAIRATPDTKQDVRKILADLSIVSEE